MSRVKSSRPFQGQFVVRGLGIAMINPYTKITIFEVSMLFAQYEDMKGNTKCRNWNGLGGYWSPKVARNVCIRWRAYDFLFDLNRNYASTL